MGKRRFNAKGRQTQKFLVDNSETKKIKVDIPVEKISENANDTNALVLPSQKRATKLKKENVTVTRILSKKQRKRLEKIVDQKEKKKNHAALVQALASVQIPKTQLSQYTSISTTQTQGLKKLKNDGKETKRMREMSIGEGDEVPLKGKRRKGMINALTVDDESDEEDETGTKPRDYNVVGVESSDSSDENDEEEEVEPEKVEEKPLEPPKSEATPVIEAKTIEKPKIIEPIDRKPATYIHLERDSKIQAARLKLPILAEEQQIMETISENTVVIIAGETGSGKTTQVPQFLYEAGYATNKMIGVTEPRRVAAISMSKRVAKEMNLSTDVVSYLMRFEGNVTEKTKIKFMTDGVLLKEVENDFLLKKYGVLILDEAHERSVFTDVLIGLLSRIVIIRAKEKDPLKLIIMSATLRVEDFTSNEVLFKTPPPVLKVEARQFPVTIHFNRFTPEDYVAEAYKKAVKIHTKLPEGGILIFVTGQKEVKSLVWKLRKAFPYKNDKTKVEIEKKESSEEELSFDEEDWDMIRHKKKKLRKKDRVREGKSKKKVVEQLPKVSLDSFKLPHEMQEGDMNEDEVDVSEAGSDSDDSELGEPIQAIAQSQPLWVLPLYSVLSSEKQALVFQDPPPGTRLCVVATNVAETSITIPNIKYVIDSGRQKSKVYDKITGVSAFVVTYTSKASANQRSGRAGRVGPGHCYRLYSSAVYNDEFQDFSVPEIQEKPVDDLMLQMRSIGIDRVDKFPFPSPPDAVQLEVAEKRLKMLGALEEKTMIRGNTTETILALTDLGKTISRFPVNPRFGKMLALSDQGGLLPYIIAIVASLSVPNVLDESLSSADDDEEEDVQAKNQSKFRAIRHKWAGEGESRALGDPMVLLKAVSSCLFDQSSTNLENFCAENGIRVKAIHEIAKIRQQLTNEININATDVNLCIDPKLPPPTDSQIHLIRQILLSGFGDQVARKLTKQEINEMEDKQKYRNAYKCADMVDPVFIHQESVLKYEDPEWVIYQEVYEVTMDDGKPRMFIRGITEIDPAWLPKYVPTLCNILKIMEKPEPRYDAVQDRIVCHVNATYSKAAWQLPLVEVAMQPSVDQYKHFARCFLNGEIFEKLREFAEVLTATPDSMNKTWVKSMPRAKQLLDVLMQNEVTTKKKLKKLWKSNKEFLLEEYKLWLPDNLHQKIKKMWPPL
ncbi:probable ATP-dependent RNA helicase kurz [Culicoides brevitarsis]|uniref:probable ATP-dependent RNA helicase kurz n=1 Tax=Culicoides brevitarsis TaxID=469753 RepID=UPI00307CC610